MNTAKTIAICLVGGMTLRIGLRFLALWCLLMTLTGCQSNSCLLEPTITYCPPRRVITGLPSPFPKLNIEERKQDWGKELAIADHFARDFDFFRAITAYKRAYFLIPKEATDRRLQIQYSIMLSYYLGCRYKDAVETFETSDLVDAGPSFPAFGDLLILLYDSYKQDERCDRADAVLELIRKHSPETAADLTLYKAVTEGDIAAAESLAEAHAASETMTPWLDGYCCQAKSVRTAQTLNAVLPGAGYFYVGQKQSALTSFLLNTLFTAAAVYFFDEGNIAAGIITTSLEAGWYIGGINGAGLAAKEYNERLFEGLGKELLCENRLFPVLMFEFAF